MSSFKEYKWFKIAESISDLTIADNGLAEVEVNGKKICLAFYNNTLMACAQTCPHAGGFLSAGYLDALGNIVCPVHRYKFSLQNGRNISGEGYFLKTFPVEIRPAGVFIALEQNNILDSTK